MTYSSSGMTYSSSGMTYSSGGMTYSSSGMTYSSGAMTYSSGAMTSVVDIRGVNTTSRRGRPKARPFSWANITFRRPLVGREREVREKEREAGQEREGGREGGR